MDDLLQAELLARVAKPRLGGCLSHSPVIASQMAASAQIGWRYL